MVLKEQPPQLHNTSIAGDDRRALESLLNAYEDGDPARRDYDLLNTYTYNWGFDDEGRSFRGSEPWANGNMENHNFHTVNTILRMNGLKPLTKEEWRNNQARCLRRILGLPEPTSVVGRVGNWFSGQIRKLMPSRRSNTNLHLKR